MAKGAVPPNIFGGGTQPLSGAPIYGISEFLVCPNPLLRNRLTVLSGKFLITLLSEFEVSGQVLLLSYIGDARG